jgi:hypothetical protein
MPPSSGKSLLSWIQSIKLVLISETLFLNKKPDNGLYRYNELLTAATIKINVFCDVTPYSLVDRYQRFEGACFLHPQDRLNQV